MGSHQDTPWTISLQSEGTPNEMEPVMSRIQSVMKSDLRVALHGGDSATHVGDIATLAYIALEPSTGMLLRFSG
jgi:hypothetical protein